MEIQIKETEREDNQKKVVGTQIPLVLYERLKDDASANFMSISDLLRKIIHLYYNQQ